MFTTSMIKYHINDKNQVITAYVEGVKDDAIDTMLKCFRAKNIILSKDYITCKKYQLPDTMSASATYNPIDIHEYSVERGKMIARRRLYNKYNRAFISAMTELRKKILESSEDMLNSIDLAYKRRVNFDNFEFYEVFNSAIIDDSVKR